MTNKDAYQITAQAAWPLVQAMTEATNLEDIASLQEWIETNKEEQDRTLALILSGAGEAEMDPRHARRVTMIKRQAIELE